MLARGHTPLGCGRALGQCFSLQCLTGATLFVVTTGANAVTSASACPRCGLCGSDDSVNRRQCVHSTMGCAASAHGRLCGYSGVRRNRIRLTVTCSVLCSASAVSAAGTTGTTQSECPHSALLWQRHGRTLPHMLCCATQHLSKRQHAVAMTTLVPIHGTGPMRACGSGLSTATALFY